MRQWGLFEKVGGKWVRLHPTRSYGKATAVRVFQSELLSGFFAGKTVELRPVKVDVAPTAKVAVGAG